MICEQCQSSLDDSDKYCRFCGQSQDPVDTALLTVGARTYPSKADERPTDWKDLAHEAIDVGRQIVTAVYGHATNWHRRVTLFISLQFVAFIATLGATVWLGVVGKLDATLAMILGVAISELRPRGDLIGPSKTMNRQDVQQ